MAMKPRKMRGAGGVKKMERGGMAGVKKMKGGGRAGMPMKMKKGGTDLATIRKMAADKGYKLVKK